MSLTLRPFSSTDADRVGHWFDNPEVQRRLGGRSWIHRAASLLDTEPGEWFRGRMVLRAHAWLALDEDAAPVAYVGGEVYDRWVRYHGEGASGPLLSEEDRRPAMGLAYAVDPTRWGRGHGRGALRAVIAHPDVADVATFSCGIDTDNVASQRCCAAAGFRLVDPEPDHEDMLYFRRER
jgi:RimJ/RimL family protein N-acetyltransferase